ncbi:DnaA regulatory inactivator Hda [Halieaceae bacterium IMCC14734]|uniref:DnaA regulatory inactivator Hda n=1 Tax=Candidatus Litorirhabdus singularis TaxID=2518993 RepID=A0ABT3TKX0_9GAMM|nr:DnaA regulatory inactivator Hda [Candidatus Litorirhabdus singularis]MCX2982976.1 DnaA regulatory inactivator Hda [Candidatus Litorirhabdus singularis]
MTIPAQLTLGVGLRDDATLNNFLFREELSPLSGVLRALSTAVGEPLVYLHGMPGSGRSHLLQAVCREFAAGQALYLPLNQFVEADAESILQDVEQMALLCLDDFEAIGGDSQWEEALFHAFNRMREQNCSLLISAQCPPRGLPLVLEDLRSRLGWGVTLHLPQPDDAEKLAILQFRAQRRGLQLSADVAQYVMARAPRSLDSLIQVLDQLDHASLAQQRALSIPFVKQTLGW